MDLNGFKEAISQQESEEENGCGLIVFGVTFLCLCHFPLQEFVGLGLCEVTNWEVAKFQKKGHSQIESKISTALFIFVA